VRFATRQQCFALAGPPAWNNPMKTVVPPCPICSGKILFGPGNIEPFVCPQCEISFVAFELFDSFDESGAVPGDSIMPFGFVASRISGLAPLRRLLRSMERVFELIVTHEAPGAMYSEAELLAYLTSLVEGQRDNFDGFMCDSWSLLPGGDADADLHDEFIHLPTYLALGTLSFVLCEMPSVTQEIPCLRPAIEKGLEFAAFRGLASHGHEWLNWRQRILTIFERGKVLSLLLERPAFSLRMCYVLGYVHQRTTEILAKTDGPIEYETRGPVSRHVYERIAEQTAAFRHFSGEERPPLP
jgi:hypothetical protein